jgi:hypothetical protein
MSMPDNRAAHNRVNGSCLDCKWVVRTGNDFLNILYQAHDNVKANKSANKDDEQVSRLFEYSGRTLPVGYRAISYGCLLNKNDYLPVVEESLSFPARDSICFDEAKCCEYYAEKDTQHNFCVWPFNSTSIYQWLYKDKIKAEVIYFLLFSVLDRKYYDLLFFSVGTELEEISLSYYIYFDLIGADYSWWERRLLSIQGEQKFWENPIDNESN